MTIEELIAKLSALPGGWQVWGTRKGSMHIEEPGTGPGRKYAFVFFDEREPVYFTTGR